MCDSVVAVGDETAGGTTLFAKNSDRKRDECQPLLQFAEAVHPPGAMLRCTHIEIPQVAETYRVLGHSPWWMWGFEHGVNEHAVAVGNHTVFSNEPIEETPGLIGMDLVRLGLERGRTAREAVEVIAGLLERYGQAGAALAPGESGYHNSFLVADPSEAWRLETTNRRWVARRTRRGGVSNHYEIAADWEIGARDLERFARAEGYWTNDERLDVAAAFRNPHVPSHLTSGRRSRSQALLDAAAGRHDVASFQRVLRDHAGAEAWNPGDATPGDEAYFTLCAHSEPVQWTTASLVAPLPRASDVSWPVWVSFGTPCTGIFVPVYLHGVIPAVLARGGESSEEESAWWVFRRLQDAAAPDLSRNTPILRAEWAKLEAELEGQRVETEEAARAAALYGDEDGARRQLTDFMSRSVTQVLERAGELAAKLA